MIDKVQKIREEVERIQLYTQSEVLKQVLDYIDEVQKEPVSEELEYASGKYACRFSSSKYGHDKIKATFIAGAKWQKEQMMKDAIEAYIRRNKYTKKNVLNGLDVTCDAIQKFNGGDKVKVILIKED